MNITPLDILFIGILIYIVVSRLRRKGGGQGGRPGMRDGGDQEDPRRQATDAYKRAQQAWDMLRSEDEKQAGNAQDVPDVDYQPEAASADAVDSRTLDKKEMPTPSDTPPVLPEGFNETEFLEGAHAFCVRIRGSWNNRDLSDLKQFCTPEGIEEFRNRAMREARPPRHEILQVNTGLVAVQEPAPGHQIAQVYYEITEKNLSSNHMEETREVWRYTRTPDTTWLLDGIETMDSEASKQQ